VKFSDETLMAYADGELDLVTRAEIEAAIATDPAIATAIERHRRLAARVRETYGGVLDETVPEQLTAFARSATVTPLRAAPPRRFAVPQWAALAASVTVALFAGYLLARAPAAPYEETEAGLVARGELDDALTTRLASATSESSVRIGMSFRERGGAYCRTFHLEREAPLAGLACRGGSDWKIRVLAAARSRHGELRTAGAMPMAVLHAVDAAIDGEPLDAAAEAKAREAGWR
jgi:hypothetical protein